MHLSDNEIHALLNTRFRGSGSDLIGLSTTVPSDHLTSGITEPVGGNYSRQSLPRGPDGWAAAEDRRIETTIPVTFSEATAGWGVIVAWVMFTPDGAPVTAGRLATGYRILTGSVATVPAGVIHVEAP